jgi:hypothetical protein
VVVLDGIEVGIKDGIEPPAPTAQVFPRKTLNALNRWMSPKKEFEHASRGRWHVF